MVNLRLSMKRCWTTLVAAAALASGASVSHAEQGVTDTQIKIGVFGAVSGGAVPTYRLIDLGALAIYEDVNRKGGIHGRKLQVVFDDDGCEPAKTRAAVKKLLSRDQVFLLHGGNCSSAVMAVRDEIINSGVPYMVMGASSDRISAPAVRNIFTTSLLSSVTAKTMFDFVASMPTPKKIVVVKHSNEWSDSIGNDLISQLKSAGLGPEQTIDMPFNSTDATAQVLQVKRADPTAVLLVLYPADLAIFLRDAEKYGVSVPFVTAAPGMDIKEIIDRAGSESAVKTMYTAAYLNGPVGSKEMQPYAELFAAAHPKEPVQTWAFAGMSGAFAVVQGLQKAGRDLTRDKFLAALESIQGGDAGPASCQLNFSSSNHQGCRSMVIWRWSGGKIVNIGNKWDQAVQ